MGFYALQWDEQSVGRIIDALTPRQRQALEVSLQLPSGGRMGAKRLAKHGFTSAQEFNDAVADAKAAALAFLATNGIRAIDDLPFAVQARTTEGALQAKSKAKTGIVREAAPAVDHEWSAERMAAAAAEPREAGQCSVCRAMDKEISHKGYSLCICCNKKRLRMLTRVRTAGL